MRKLKAFVMLLLLAAAAVLLYKYDLDIKKENSRQSMIQELEAKQVEEAASKVDDAAIIKKALKSVGILTVLEGEEEYRQTMEEENWYSYRAIKIDWRYRFGIAMNLEDVHIDAAEGQVDITVDNAKLFLQFIEKSQDSTSSSQASLFAKQYSSQEISVLEKAVREKIEDKITSTQSYWVDAMKSLEANITKICNDLGYYHISFIRKAAQEG